MNTFKMGVQGKESASGGDCVGLNLRLLTLDAGTCPLSDVSIDPWPYKL